MLRKYLLFLSTAAAALAWVRIPPCGHCHKIQIRCENGSTRTDRPKVTVVRNSNLTGVEWGTLPSDNSNWVVTFDSDRPCGRPRIDNQNPVCEVTGPPGRYVYRVKLEGCKRERKGEIIVK
jgi:hypothetical protein